MNRHALAASAAIQAQSEKRSGAASILLDLAAVRSCLAKLYRDDALWEPLDRATRTACGMLGHQPQTDGIVTSCERCGEGM